MSVEIRSPHSENPVAGDSALLRSLSRLSPINLELNNLNADDFSSFIQSTKRNADSELNGTLEVAQQRFASLTPEQQQLCLKVCSTLVQKCSSVDMLDDNGQMLSPNATLNARKEASLRALTRALAGINSKSELVKSFEELTLLLESQPGAGAPRELLSQRAKLAFHSLYEIGTDDRAHASQKNDVTCVLTVQNKDLTIDSPSKYIQLMRQWALEGIADISLDADRTISVQYENGAISANRLMDRTLGCAIYQNSVASHYGIIETGMLPVTAEKYYDDVLGGVKLLTPTTEVCSNTTSSDQIMQAAGKSEWVGVSMKWAAEGATHNNHFLRLKGTCEIDGKTYVRLENPWSSEDNKNIPAEILAVSKLVGGRGNELVMDAEEFKKRIYFALVKTDAQDIGETAGLNKENTTITIFPDNFMFELVFKIFDFNKGNKKKEETPITVQNSSAQAQVIPQRDKKEAKQP